MEENRRWMYEGWKKRGALSSEWVAKTDAFLDHAFARSETGTDVRCPCSKCRNINFLDRRTMSIHICKNGYMPGYEVWVHHGEDPPPRIVSEVQSHEEEDYDRMEEMLDDVRHEFLTVDSENPGQPTEFEDPATPEVQKFFELLKAAEEPLHEHTKVTVLVFVTRLMAIKSKFAFSNNCYKELLNLISDVLPENHKMPKDMYQSKKLLSGLGMDYEKIDVCENNCMLFWKETAGEKKCTVCGERRFVEVENDDGLTVTTKIARKQLRYMPLIPRLKRLFISKNTARHMRWHKEGVRENPNVMVHPADTDAWKALDAFDSSFADEVRNVRFGLATDGFSPFNLTATSYSCWPVFAVPYNLPPALCMKYEFIFLCLVIPGPDHPGT